MDKSIYSDLSIRLAKDGDLTVFAASYINEYLQKNIKGLEDVISKIEIDPRAGKETVTHHLKTIEGYNYRIIQENFPDTRLETEPDIDTMDGEIHGRVEDDVTLIDAINNKEEVIVFNTSIDCNVEDQYVWSILKEQFNENGAYVEDYIPGLKVTTDIFDREEHKKAVLKNDNLSFNHLILDNYCPSPVRYVMDAARKSKPVRNVVATCNPVSARMICMIEEYEGDKLVDRRRVVGKPIYTAYYDYMLEKGYFISGCREKDIIR